MQVVDLAMHDDYFRPADFGWTIEEFRYRFDWLTEYGDAEDPFYSWEEFDENDDIAPSCHSEDRYHG